MQVDPGRLVADEGRRHVGVDADLHPRQLLRRGSSPCSCAVASSQHRQVHLEAHRGDLARLLLPQQLAGAPDLQVAHGDLEAGAQLGVVGQGGEPRHGFLGEHRLVGMEQEGVGHPGRAADASPDLVELSQAQQIGPLHDERVGVGDVEAALDDGGGHQHVGVAAQELEHHPLQLLLGHLAVGDREAHLRA